MKCIKRTLADTRRGRRKELVYIFHVQNIALGSSTDVRLALTGQLGEAFWKAKTVEERWDQAAGLKSSSKSTSESISYPAQSLATDVSAFF